MLPTLVTLDWFRGMVAIPAYGTMLLAAALVGGWLAVSGAGASLAQGPKSVHRPRLRALAVVAGCILAGAAGARALDVALDAGWYAEDPGRMLAVEPRGFALAGGLAAAAAAGVAGARWLGVGVGLLADHAVEALAAALVLLRIGCFLNGCCAGEPTDLPWGVTFPYGSSAWGAQVLSGHGGLLALSGHVDPVHPTQLYEAAAAILCCTLAIAVRRHTAGPAGSGALTFASAFLAIRVAVEALRPGQPGATLPHEVLVALYAAGAVTVAALLVGRWVTLRPRVASAGLAG